MNVFVHKILVDKYLYSGVSAPFARETWCSLLCWAEGWPSWSDRERKEWLTHLVKELDELFKVGPRISMVQFTSAKERKLWRVKAPIAERVLLYSWWDKMALVVLRFWKYPLPPNPCHRGEWVFRCELILGPDLRLSRSWVLWKDNGDRVHIAVEEFPAGCPFQCSSAKH